MLFPSFLDYDADLALYLDILGKDNDFSSLLALVD